MAGAPGDGPSLSAGLSDGLFAFVADMLGPDLGRAHRGGACPVGGVAPVVGGREITEVGPS